MKICIVTPAPPQSRKGNRVTALRWARLLRELGHRVSIDQEFRSQRCDVLVALHARRSFASIQRFARLRPRVPLVVALTGTDLFPDIRRSTHALESLRLADRLILLQPHGRGKLPPAARRKARVIYQSATPPRRRPAPLVRCFEVCVIGHLRPVKDPFRAALAARRLPADSRIHITHLGAALSESMARRASRETERNPHYRWLGEQPPARARRLLARGRLLVISSKLEGCPNVASEALAADVPMLSTKISGMIGLLGRGYPGYFRVGDTRELADLLYRAETDSRFYTQLQIACRRVRHLVAPGNESAAWKNLLEEL